MQVLGVEEDPPGVGVDVGARSDEQRGDVSLPPLDGDVQCRLPWNRVGMGALSGWARGPYSLWPLPLSGLRTLHGATAKS